jgi:hypothetical protein
MFEKLGKLVFQDVPTEQSVPKAAAPVAPTSAPVTSAPVPTAGLVNNDQEKINKFKSVLYDAIEKNAGNGLPFDYYKFKQAVKANESVISDERIRFVSAFQTAKILKVTKEQLLAAANHSLEVIASEEKSFQDLVKEQQVSIDNLEKQIVDLSSQIAQKQVELEQLNKTRQEISTQRDQENAKLAAGLGNYHAATLAVSNDIKSDIDKITTYLEQ